MSELEQFLGEERRRLKDRDTSDFALKADLLAFAEPTDDVSIVVIKVK